MRTPIMVLLLAVTLQAQNSIIYLSPGVVQPLEACYYVNNQGKQGVTATYSVAPVVLKSGFHTHDTGLNRPNLSVQYPGKCTTGTNGCCTLNVTVPWYSGSYEVDAFFSAGGAAYSQLIAYKPGLAYTSFSGLFGVNGQSQFINSDPGHPGNYPFFCSSGLPIRIKNAGGLYALDTPFIELPFYWSYEISRLSLPNGGALDSFIYWGIQQAEMHPDGWQLDVRNPNVPARQASLLNAFRANQCIVSNTAGMFWHVQC